MNTQLNAMKKALEALESGDGWRQSEAITALRTAIEQAEKQEPVAWVEKNGDFVWQNYEAAIGRNLYTTPPAAPVQEFVCSTGLCHYKANKENT